MLCGGGEVPIDTFDDLLGISLNGVNGDELAAFSFANISSISRSGDGPQPVDTPTLRPSPLSLITADASSIF